MVYEIRPNIAWHKGAAVDYLLRLIYPDLPPHSQQDGAAVPELRRADGTEIVPVYIGDDTTDEDAFRLLRQYNRGSSHALSVFVRPDDKARHSAANYVVRDPHEVGELLHLLAKL
jgi:trehalose-phosphatase